MLHPRIVNNILFTAVCSMILISFVVSTATAASQIIVVNNDGPNEGFNDSTTVPALPGNPATTLGAQRLAAFTAAAQVWEAALDSAVPIRVQANMDPQICSPTGGILGSAGPQTAFRDFTNSPVANTWYSVALANSLAGSDLDPTGDDIGATFNSDVDDDPNCLTGNKWWYGINAPAPSGTISFYDTILHEIGHGINVLTFVNSTTGEKFLGQNDIYMTFLEDGSQGISWPDMTNSQRAASAIDTGDLRWTGSLANACGQAILNTGLSDGHVRMYAPNPFQQGSSVSHWDTALSPDELMEPSATPTSDQRITEALLRDIGWKLSSQSCIDQSTKLPDLVVSIRAPGGTVKQGQDISRKIKLNVQNIGDAPAEGTQDASNNGYMVDVVLSKDNNLPIQFATFSPNFHEDVLLQGGRVSNTKTLNAGGSTFYPVGAKIPVDTPPGSYCLGAVVDPGEKVQESEEANNTSCHPIEVVKKPKFDWCTDDPFWQIFDYWCR